MQANAISLFLVAALLAAAPAAAQQQRSARSGITQRDVVELQWRAYAEFASAQRERGTAVDDAARTLNVDQIFARLLTVAWRRYPLTVGMRWEVLLTDDAHIEAHAYPSGQVVLSSHFIKNVVRSESELAFVLAHEIAHVLLEHARQGYEAAVPLTRLVGPVDARLIDENLKSSLSLSVQLSPLLRAQEREADRLGVDLADTAGYASHAAVNLLERMGEGDGGFARTHDAAVLRGAALRGSLELD